MLPLLILPYLDMDSIVTAISWAFVEDEHLGRPLVPILNTTNPAVIDMRGEVTAVLGECCINHREDLLCSGDVFAIYDQPDFFLVDHNEVAGGWQRDRQVANEKESPLGRATSMDFSIVGILDHHEDAGAFPKALPRIIEPCGSTSSLLVRYALDNDALAKRTRLHVVAKLLLQTIIFDTVNLTWRQRQVDFEAVHSLCNLLNLPQGTTGIIHQELDQAVSNTPEDFFGIYDLLHKDYKLYVHQGVLFYGIATLHLPFAQMIGPDAAKLDAWVSEVRRFMKDQHLEMLIMTNAFRRPNVVEHFQQLALFFAPSVPDHALSSLQRELQGRGADLQLLYEGPHYALYDQLNITISRKQLHPIAKLFMHSLSPISNTISD